MPHVLASSRNHYSYGFSLNEKKSPDRTVFITTDTLFRSELFDQAAKNSSLIFHDCETAPFKSNVHAHYDELLTLPLKVRKKIWLYHYQPKPDYDPEKDGFKGFVVKGQEFSIP